MPRHQLSRGRPKGSGLDDHSYLATLNSLLDADPGLKPTTAIRSMGVNEPSTVRRLREKLRSTRNAKVSKPAKAIAARNAERVSTKSQIPAAPSAGETRTPSARSDAFDHSWIVQWYGLGISAIRSTVAVQMAAIESLLVASPAALALKQHLAFNKRVMAFCGSSSDVRKTLH